jgi:hypothetical protein
MKKKILKICLATIAAAVTGVQLIIISGCTVAYLRTGQCNTDALSGAIMTIPLIATFALWLKTEEDFKR